MHGKALTGFQRQIECNGLDSAANAYGSKSLAVTLTQIWTQDENTLVRLVYILIPLDPSGEQISESDDGEPRSDGLLLTKRSAWERRGGVGNAVCFGSAVDALIKLFPSSYSTAHVFLLPSSARTPTAPHSRVTSPVYLPPSPWTISLAQPPLRPPLPSLPANFNHNPRPPKSTPQPAF